MHQRRGHDLAKMKLEEKLKEKKRTAAAKTLTIAGLFGEADVAKRTSTKPTVYHKNEEPVKVSEWVIRTASLVSSGNSVVLTTRERIHERSFMVDCDRSFEDEIRQGLKKPKSQAWFAKHGEGFNTIHDIYWDFDLSFKIETCEDVENSVDPKELQLLNIQLDYERDSWDTSLDELTVHKASSANLRQLRTALGLDIPLVALVDTICTVTKGDSVPFILEDRMHDLAQEIPDYTLHTPEAQYFVKESGKSLTDDDVNEDDDMQIKNIFWEGAQSGPLLAPACS